MRRSITTAGSLAVGAALFFASAMALGHAELRSPAPRDDAGCNGTVAACKSSPCGGKSKGAIRATWKANDTVPIKFAETINHTGCFIIELSPTGKDNDFVPYAVIKDNKSNLEQTKNIQLDGGVSCASCTLRLRQLMGADPNNCGPTTMPSDGTYYQCSDVMILLPDGGTPGAGKGDSGTSSGTDSGSGGSDPDPSTDTDAGHSGSDAGDEDEDNGGSPKDSGGCSTIPGDLPYGGAIGVGLMAAFALIARSRKRNK
jgi:hypothetical protein